MSGTPRGRLPWLALVLALWGCSESVDVLAPEPPPASTPRFVIPDGGLDAPDLPDPPGSTLTGEACDCPASELCTPGGCVPREGSGMLEAGRDHACLIDGGRLFCWGANGSGQLGVGDLLDRFEVTRVGDDDDWLAISGGERHSCGIRAPGALYCWGDNSQGQLGVGDTGKRLAPARVGSGVDWERIFCGGDNCCAMRDAGELHCWGENHEGKAGQADSYSAPDVLEPLPVAGDMRYREVALGQGHVMAIDLDGELVGWGRMTTAETGMGSFDNHLREPTRVFPDGDDGADWMSVAAGQHHSCGVREDGTLWCWGGSQFGEVGRDVVMEGSLFQVPARIGDREDWAGVAVGWFHTCAVTMEDELYCWGRAIEGQLGQGGGEPVTTPTLIAPAQRWQLPVLGGFYTCARDAERVLHCWGMNSQGQLAMGDDERRHTPAPVPGL